MAVNIPNEINGAGPYPSRRYGQRERNLIKNVVEYLEGVQPKAMVSATYDFSVHGGTIGSVGLGVTIPAGAIITSVIQDIQVSPNSSDDLGTLRPALPTDGNITQSAITADGAATGVSSAGGSAVPKKASADRVVQATIATTALSAGKVTWHIEYIVP